jgi:crotonobetainyl-CoA:carnitine CoA-transferase CaiB-like acyl-CoA transferase
MVGAEAVDWARTGSNPQRIGNRAPSFAPQGCYPCAGEDQWIYLSAPTQTAWEALASVLRITDPKFASPRGRIEDEDRLDAAIGDATRQRHKFALMSELQEHGVVAAAVLDGEEVLNDPHYAARGVFDPLRIGPYPLSVQKGVAARSQWLRPKPSALAPSLGEHNREILRSLLGLDDATIEGLQAAGVIGDVPAVDVRRGVGVPVEQYLRLGSVRRARVSGPA